MKRRSVTPIIRLDPWMTEEPVVGINRKAKAEARAASELVKGAPWNNARQVDGREEDWAEDGEWE